MRFCRTFLLIFHILCSKKVCARQIERVLFNLKDATPCSRSNYGYVTTIDNDMAYTCCYTKHWHKLPLSCYGHTATIVGTPESDDIVGTQGQDVIVTLGGRDRVHALDGDDIICGGPGPNTIIGGAGDDLIDGFNGTDFLSGGNDDDRIIGGAGNDALFGEDGNDRLDGGAGNDALFGEDGDDFLFGDAIDGGTGRRNIDNGDGGPDFDTCVDIETVTNCEG